MENKTTLTIRIKDSTYERAKVIAYYTPGLTLSEFVQVAMDKHALEYDEYPDKKVILKKGPR